MKRNALFAALAALIAGLLVGCGSMGSQGRAYDTVDQIQQQDLQGGPN